MQIIGNLSWNSKNMLTCHCIQYVVPQIVFKTFQNYSTKCFYPASLLFVLLCFVVVSFYFFIWSTLPSFPFVPFASFHSFSFRSFPCLSMQTNPNQNGIYKIGCKTKCKLKYKNDAPPKKKEKVSSSGCERILQLRINNDKP